MSLSLFSVVSHSIKHLTNICHLRLRADQCFKCIFSSFLFRFVVWMNIALSYFWWIPWLISHRLSLLFHYLPQSPWKCLFFAMPCSEVSLEFLRLSEECVRVREIDKERERERVKCTSNFNFDPYLSFLNQSKWKIN